MKITHGTAMYTGGGFYSVIGEIDDGNYFVGNMDWCVVVDSDPREKDEFGEWNFFHIEWLEDHDVHADVNEIYPMFKDFCERLDANEKDITKGWDELSNYIPGEVTEMIDFSEFDEWKGDKEVMNDYKEVTPETFEREYKRVVKKFLEDGEPSDSPANQDTYIYWNGMKCNIGSGADMYSYMIDGLAKRIRNDEWVMTPISATDIADTIVEMIKNNSNIECDTDDTPMLIGVKDVWHDENVVHLNMEDGTEFTIGVCKQ